MYYLFVPCRVILGYGNVSSGSGPGGGLDGTGMSGRRKVALTWKRYCSDLGRFPFVQLLMGIGVLVVWSFLFGVLAEEVAATGRVVRGEGVRARSPRIRRCAHILNFPGMGRSRPATPTGSPSTKSS